jgi:hypothetical protein
MTRILFLWVMAMGCAVAVAADNVPLVFRAETNTFFHPGFQVEATGGTLAYKVVYYSDEEKRGVTLKSMKFTPTAAQWKEFRETLDGINVWRWQDKYEPPPMPDGGGWSLEIKYPDKQIKSQGANGYPDADGKMPRGQNGIPTASYQQLIEAISKLLGGLPFDSRKDDHGIYAVLTWPLPRIVFRDATCAEALDFLHWKATENLRQNPKNKDAELKFEYRYDTSKRRGPVNYDRKSVIYATAFIEVLQQLGLDYEMLAPDRILIKDRDADEGKQK